jgi:ubiquinone/menaquinone biosynthesis C-methylase UbiE
MLAHARRKIDECGLRNIELREGDACTADLPQEGFDPIFVRRPWCLWRTYRQFFEGGIAS